MQDLADFSSYQVKKLVKQSVLSGRISSIESQMNERVPQDVYCLSDHWYSGGQQVKSGRVTSEDNSHYILIKGLTDSQQSISADLCHHESAQRSEAEKSPLFLRTKLSEPCLETSVLSASNKRQLMTRAAEGVKVEQTIDDKFVCSGGEKHNFYEETVTGCHLSDQDFDFSGVERADGVPPDSGSQGKKVDGEISMAKLEGEVDWSSGVLYEDAVDHQGSHSFSITGTVTCSLGPKSPVASNTYVSEKTAFHSSVDGTVECSQACVSSVEVTDNNDCCLTKVDNRSLTRCESDGRCTLVVPHSRREHVDRQNTQDGHGHNTKVRSQSRRSYSDSPGIQDWQVQSNDLRSQCRLGYNDDMEILGWQGQSNRLKTQDGCDHNDVLGVSNGREHSAANKKHYGEGYGNTFEIQDGRDCSGYLEEHTVLDSSVGNTCECSSDASNECRTCSGRGLNNMPDIQTLHQHRTSLEVSDDRSGPITTQHRDGVGHCDIDKEHFGDNSATLSTCDDIHNELLSITEMGEMLRVEEEMLQRAKDATMASLMLSLRKRSCMLRGEECTDGGDTHPAVTSRPTAVAACKGELSFLCFFISTFRMKCLHFYYIFTLHYIFITY